jgi:hypothetical protein
LEYCALKPEVFMINFTVGNLMGNHARMPLITNPQVPDGTY